MIYVSNAFVAEKVAQIMPLALNFTYLGSYHYWYYC